MDVVYTELLPNGSLLPNSLEASCVEMGSSNGSSLNAVLHKEAGEQTEDLNGDGHELIIPHGQGEAGEEAAGLAIFGHENGGKEEVARVKRKKYRGPRSWKEKWQELYPWAFVKIVQGEERMFCTICEAHGNTSTRNAFRKEGSSNFQPSALSTHANSSAHKNALLAQQAWAESGKMGSGTKNRGKVPVVSDYGAIATHLSSMATKLNNVVTRDELDALKAELRITQRCKDARRINSCCALTDPLMPVPTLEGMIPDNFPNSLAELVVLPPEPVESLLIAYGLPVHGTVDAKLRRLKAHLGFRHLSCSNVT